LPWDHILCISSRVNAVAHCMLAKHADTFTHVSQSIWESRLWLEKNALSQPCLVYSLTKRMHKHPVSASYFKILSSGTSEWDLLIRESLLISQLNPVLNANIRSTPLELFYLCNINLNYTNHALNIDLYLLTSYW
jgi:hypothetical protein